jgi:alkanesulfonate monooxygenase SsuD/methylene tetrahydromethanopterin reductase-like flavin-dependent oxidoreductase (luciferase family)
VGDYLAAGFSGLQGFQYELGVDVFDLDRLRGPAGERLLFFTGLSVTRTLPLGTPEQVREEIRYFYDATDSGRRMFLITSNTTGIEVPVENLRMGYAYAGSLRPRGRLFGPPRPWPVVRGRAR